MSIQFNENDAERLVILENQGNLFYLLVSQEVYQVNKRSKYREDTFLLFVLPFTSFVSFAYLELKSNAMK